MGQKMTTNKHKLPKGEEVSRNRFDFQNIIGRGGFGKVWRVIDKKLKVHYALKEMQKVKVIDKKSEKSIKYERELLSHLKHPFIVNMYYAFQDYDNLYLVMDLLTGGDLRYHVCRHRKFTEEQTPCIVLALEYIHSKNVIHRDIKPENLVLDDKGYVRITDFGIAKLYSNKNGSETSGTPGYMSPEVMKGHNHSMPVDYFALGVMGYEFMLGCRPYVGKSRKEIKEQMMAKQANIKLSDVPDGWSEEAVDFINKLLIRKPESRLGAKGAQEVKNHPWLRYFQWDELAKKTLKAPFVPDKKDNFDKRYCNNADKIGVDTKERYEKHIISNQYTSIFENFTYYPILDTISNEDNDNIEKNQSIHRHHTASKSSMTPGNNVKERQLKYSQSKPDLSHFYKRTTQRPGTAGIISPKAIENLSQKSLNNDNHLETPKMNKLNRHNPNSKSTNNFKNYPIKKSSINLNQLQTNQPSSNYIVLSDNNTTIPMNKNEYKTIEPSPKIMYPNKTKTIDHEALKNNYHSHQDDIMKKRGKSISAVFKHIRASSNSNNVNQSRGNSKGLLQRSSSTYGNLSAGKHVYNSSINPKTQEQTNPNTSSGYNSSAIKHIPRSAKPSSQMRIPQQKPINKSGTVNVLFRNYKVSSSTSGNSTGSSMTNNNNNTNKKLK